jgi:RNA polymerase sigma-70 factor (ECF subfamily)
MMPVVDFTLRGESDAMLVKRCRCEATTGAFTVLFERHNAHLLRVAALSLGPSHGDAVEEVVQEAWMIAFRSLARLERPDRLVAWLSRITQRRAADHLRLGAGAPRRESVEFLASVSMDPRRGPDARVLARERRRLLISGISKLPPPLPMVLRQHYWLGTTVTEIAALLGVGPNTVKSYLFRARRRLRSLLAAKGASHR